MRPHEGKKIIVPEGAGNAGDPVEKIRPVRRIYRKKPGKRHTCQGTKAGNESQRLLRMGNDFFRKKGQVVVRLSAEIFSSLKDPLSRPGRQVPVPVLA